MEDWIDEVQEDMCEMLHVLVKKYNLTSGDITPEDAADLARVILNYREHNKPQEN